MHTEDTERKWWRTPRTVKRRIPASGGITSGTSHIQRDPTWVIGCKQTRNKKQVSRSPTPPATYCPSPDPRRTKKYHVVGDLVVTPFSLMANCVNELERLISRTADLARSTYILSASARYLLMACCETATHCDNLRGKDDVLSTPA